MNGVWENLLAQHFWDGVFPKDCPLAFPRCSLQPAGGDQHLMGYGCRFCYLCVHMLFVHCPVLSSLSIRRPATVHVSLACTCRWLLLTRSSGGDRESNLHKEKSNSPRHICHICPVAGSLLKSPAPNWLRWRMRLPLLMEAKSVNKHAGRAGGAGGRQT